MATASRHSSGPHGSGASLEEMRGWRAFLHLASELKLSRLARLAYPYRRRAALSLVAMVVVTLSSLAVPYLLKVAIDGGIGAKDMTVLTWVIVAFVAISLVNLGASYLQTYLTSWVGEHVIYDLRRQLFAHLQKLSLDFFSRQKTGWIVSRLTNDIDALDQLVTDGVTSLVTNSLTFVGAIVFLFILDWRLALATLSVMPFLIAATLWFRSRSARSYADVRNKIGDVSAHLQESISGVRVLQAFRREQSDYERLQVANAEYRDVNMRTVVQSGLYFPFVEFISTTAVVIVLWYGGSLISGNTLEIGVLVAFIGYLNSFFDPLQQLSQLYNTFQASMAAVQKIYTVLDTDPDMLDAPDAVDLPDVRGAVELHDVTFGYNPDKPVLHDVDLTIPAGGTVALVGATGAGKSTLFKLVARFYDPQGGGSRSTVWTCARSRHASGASSSRSFRRRRSSSAGRSLTTSASRGHGEVTTSTGASRASRCPRLRRGARTATTPRSGGRVGAQRRAAAAGQFARALLADPRVLILDEATSNVDTESERRIQRA